MTQRLGPRGLLIVLAFVVIAAIIGWRLFRPELLVLDATVTEAFPTSQVVTGSAVPRPQSLIAGRFRGLAHETAGEASVYAIGGRHVLRLSNFRTSNGPDVHVYLVAASDAPDDATVKREAHIDLGVLKGNVGDQNYDVPAGTDLGRYRAVAIWCVRFGVNFGSAALTAP